MSTTWEEAGFGSYSVTEVPHVLLPMKDGVNIALKLWLPTSLPVQELFEPLVATAKFLSPKEIYVSTTPPPDKETRFPCILEYLPYCKDHWTGPRDYSRLTWFASHGFVSVRADMRGSGTAEGFLDDEYLPQEQADTAETIEWLASQAWSNGRVGMYGKSWGGFNGLQLAYEQPKGLAAAVSAYSLDDRYREDIHFMGGCVVGNGMLSWAAQMFLWQARPPHPQFYSSEEEWKLKWKERLTRSSKSWLYSWISHQTRKDPYWSHASVIEDISRVRCPILVVGGLADGYCTSAFRMAATLNEQSRAVIGPWSHDWPDTSNPGPRIDFLTMCLQWWEYHLKEPSKAKEDVSKWPRLRCFVRETAEPLHFHDTYPGFWMNVPDWNSRYSQFQSAAQKSKKEPRKICNSEHLLVLAAGENRKLYFNPTSGTELEPVHMETHGLQGDSCGEWLSWGGSDLPGDQRVSNKHSYCWETDPLKEDLILAGCVVANLRIKATKAAKYNLAVRLCDILPDGKANRITFGVKNCAQWKGMEDPEKCLPENKEVDVTVDLRVAMYVIPAGHRLSVAISPSYFPAMFTTPQKDGLIVYPQHLRILAQTQKLLSENRTQFCPPRPLVKISSEVGRAVTTNNFSDYKLCADGTYVCGTEADDGEVYLPTLGVGLEETTREEYRVRAEGDWSKATSTRHLNLHFPQQHLHTSIHIHSQLEDGGDKFLLKEKLSVGLNGETFFEMEWKDQVPREYV